MPKSPGLSLRTAVSTSTGLASAAINFLACVEVAVYAGGNSAWLAILVAGMLIVLSGLNFSELNGLYPSAAAIRVWMRRGLNDRLSLVVSLVYATTVVLVIAADAFVLAHAFETAVPQVPGIVWIVVLLALITWGNHRGVKVSGAVQDANAFFLLATLIALSLVVVLKVPLPPVAHLIAIKGGFVQAVVVGVFVYMGFEWVTPLAEEFGESRQIPRGMFIALGLIAVAFSLFTLALQLTFPDASALKNSLAPQLAVGLRALGPVGFWWMAIVTLTTAGTTFNGGLLTASRFIYALARERVLPPSWARLNQHWVPDRALWGLAALALVLSAVVYWSGRYTLLINAGAGVESLTYAVVALLVIQLRRREPNRARPFRVAASPWLPALAMVLFFGLGVGALLTSPTPGGIPWPLLLVGVLVLGAWVYVKTMVPRFKNLKVRAGPRTFD